MGAETVKKTVDTQGRVSLQENVAFSAILVKGETIEKLPKDLYVPPDALAVYLDMFQGPLDFLLYLIKRNDMDILDIQVAEITEQYMRYICAMDANQFELAGEYLVMAAMLMEIKSRMLLPKQEDDIEEEEDPRAELVRRLQEYEQFQQAACKIDQLPREGRDTFSVHVLPPDVEKVKIYPDVELKEITLALMSVIDRNMLFGDHVVMREVLSTRERMVAVLNRLRGSGFVPFLSFLIRNEGRMGVVVTFLALMELVKEALVELVQNEEYGSIHVKVRSE